MSNRLQCLTYTNALDVLYGAAGINIAKHLQTHYTIVIPLNGG